MIVFIKSFVNEAFVKNINIDNIDLPDKSFVSDEFLQRELVTVTRLP